MMSCNRRTAGSKSAQRQLLQLPPRPPLAKSNFGSRCLAMLSPSSLGQAWGDGVGKGRSSSAPRAHSTQRQSFGAASVGEGLDFRSLPCAHRSGSLGAWLDTSAVLSLRLTERTSTSTTHNEATTRWGCKYGVRRQVLHSTEPRESQDGRRTECLPACPSAGSARMPWRSMETEASTRLSLIDGVRYRDYH